MSLILRVIGPPDKGVIDDFEFYAGEDRTLTLQVYETENSSPASIPSDSVKELVLAGTSDDVIIEDADIDLDVDNSSIFSVDLTEATTALLQSGAIKFTYTSGGITRIAVKELALRKLTSGV